MYAPSLGALENSSLFIFFVTSQTKHILSRGSSFFLAVLCITAVRNDCGLKNPEIQTDNGKMKSDVQAWSSLILRRRSAYQAERPLSEA